MPAFQLVILASLVADAVGIFVQPSKSTSSSTSKPEDYVELLTGTDTPGGSSKSDGNVLPQLKRPHGMNDWVPLTNPDGGSWWFRRGDKNFYGMQCTHQPSPWIGDYAKFFVQPHMASSPGALHYEPEESDFHPYLFKTVLKERGSYQSKIAMEFTATSRAAMARITFPHGNKDGHVSVNIKQGNLEFTNDNMLRGRAMDMSHDTPPGWRGMFFVVKPSSPPSKAGTISGYPSMGTFTFSSKGPVTLAIGTSFISYEQAAANMHRELGANASFEKVLDENRQAWRRTLNRVRVEAFDKERLSVFYTNLWRSMLFPRNLHEVTADGKVEHFSPYSGKVEPGRLVADSGFWDSYRSVYTLKSIIAPQQFSNLATGWINAYKEAEWLPQWSSPNQVGSMVGTMGDSVLADAIVKSKWGVVPKIDTATAYAAIRKDAFVESTAQNFGRVGLSAYIRDGYVTSNIGESVTISQDYWLADASIALAAKALGKTEDAKVLTARSKRYTELFNPRTLFFQPKAASGSFDPNFEPLDWRNGFTEASAWQYRFEVPHDVEGLSKLYGGHLCDKVGELLHGNSGSLWAHVGGYGSVIHEMEEAKALEQDFGMYSHSNQPTHHILWIAKRAGCNELADQYLRKATRKLYTKRGWAGDEDNGEMASWFILASLGVFQLEPGKDELVLGSPAVMKATVDLAEGRSLTIATQNQAEDHVYVRKVMWAPSGGSAREMHDSTIKYTELMKGGVLTFTMGKTPGSVQGKR